MKIRPFRKSDADAVARLFQDTVREVNRADYTEAQVRAWAPDDRHFRDWAEVCSSRFTFVAEEEGSIRGFAELEENGHVDCFYVHKEYQRVGVDSRLYQALEEKARELGLSSLYTEASITAKPFFQSRGFTVLKEQLVETRGELLTNLVMEKALRPALKLSLVGYWNEADSEHNYIEPQALAGWWDPLVKPKVVRYLESGRRAIDCLGYSWCRFNCGVPDERMGSGELTDGRWIWPEGLSHYVREHDVRLPEPFVAQMEQNDWAVPEIDPSEYEITVTAERWLEYCRKQKGMPD